MFWILIKLFIVQPETKKNLASELWNNFGAMKVLFPNKTIFDFYILYSELNKIYLVVSIFFSLNILKYLSCSGESNIDEYSAVFLQTKTIHVSQDHNNNCFQFKNMVMFFYHFYNQNLTFKTRCLAQE